MFLFIINLLFDFIFQPNRPERVVLAIEEVVSKMMNRVMEENNHFDRALYTDIILGNVGLGRLRRIRQVLNRSTTKL